MDSASISLLSVAIVFVFSLLELPLPLSLLYFQIAFLPPASVVVYPYLFLLRQLVRHPRHLLSCLLSSVWLPISLPASSAALSTAHFDSNQGS